jgi:hypothetical protein
VAVNKKPDPQEEFQELNLDSLRARADHFGRDHSVIGAIDMYHHSREYGGGCRYALVLELHGFNPDKEPWKGYLKRGDIRVEAGRLADAQVEAGRLADRHETTPEHLKSATIAGLVFEAGLLFPDREFYRSGSWIDSTVDLKDQWYVHERFPDDPLPENIKQAPV